LPVATSPAFAAQDSPIALAPARWQTYRDSVTAIFGAAPAAKAPIAEWRALANRLIEAQGICSRPRKTLRPIATMWRAIAASRSPNWTQARAYSLLDEVANRRRSRLQPRSGGAQAPRLQIDNIERSARFRSDRDKKAMAAQYYCFVAGAIVALLPPERQQTVTLESFGTTIPCRDLGRTG
jgi:hypothetical protein